MRTQVQRTATLGELILAVFDKAALYSADPREIACMATQAVSDLLRHAPKLPLSRPSLTCDS